MSKILLITPVKYIPREIGKQLGRYTEKAGVIGQIIRRKDNK
jgi:hypothetical protein